MANLTNPLQIPPAILNSIYCEARSVYPAECCGWLTGAADGDSVDAMRPAANAQASGNHPTAADRTAETAYVFDTADLLALNDSLDSETPGSHHLSLASQRPRLPFRHRPHRRYQSLGRWPRLPGAATGGRD